MIQLEKEERASEKANKKKNKSSRKKGTKNTSIYQCKPGRLFVSYRSRGDPVIFY